MECNSNKSLFSFFISLSLWQAPTSLARPIDYYAENCEWRCWSVFQRRRLRRPVSAAEEKKRRWVRDLSKGEHVDTDKVMPGSPPSILWFALDWMAYCSPSLDSDGPWSLIGTSYKLFLDWRAEELVEEDQGISLCTEWFKSGLQCISITRRRRRIFHLFYFYDYPQSHGWSSGGDTLKHATPSTVHSIASPSYAAFSKRTSRGTRK